MDDSSLVATDDQWATQAVQHFPGYVPKQSSELGFGLTDVPGPWSEQAPKAEVSATLSRVEVQGSPGIDGVYVPMIKPLVFTSYVITQHFSFPKNAVRGIG